MDELMRMILSAVEQVEHEMSAREAVELMRYHFAYPFRYLN